MRSDMGFDCAAALLPVDMRGSARALPERTRREAEELRLRSGRPPTVLAHGAERPFGERSVSLSDLDTVLETATRASAHAALADVSSGFVTVRGGCRVGLCGQAVLRENGALTLRRLSSVCIRIPHEAAGCADGIWQALSAGGFADTLIISPPGAGKTTLLRELTRLLSREGRRVSVIDERGEVAGMWEGESAFDLGPCTDVLTGAPKADAAMLLLRSMSPEVLVMDEITSPGDVEAVYSAAGCGVKLLATAHALRADTLMERPLYRALLAEGIFKRAVTISRRGNTRIYEVSTL